MTARTQIRLRQQVVLFLTVVIAIVAVVLAVSVFSSIPGDETTLWLSIIGLAVMPFLYFIPSRIAANRNHRNFAAICCLNAFLGWTFIGWVAALVWALVEQERRDSAP